MKLPYLLPLLAVAAAHAEEKTDLAAADAYRPQYDFSPPPGITPPPPPSASRWKTSLTTSARG